MIRPIDIRLNAAHPDLPLAEAATYTGAPSTVLIRGVPGNCGRWAITAVFVAATFPDGSTSTRTAVQSANGVWVATLPATATSGRTAHGLRILADGTDENGEAVAGYVLGVADFAVASLAVTPAPEPGETSWQMLYFDAVPGVLRKGDVTKIDGVLKLYNGTAWEAFANVPAASTATPAMDGVGSAGASTSYARGDHVHPTDTSRMAATATGADIAVSGTDATKINAALAGKASTADATLTARGFSEWTITPATYEGYPLSVEEVNLGGEDRVFKIIADGVVIDAVEGLDSTLSLNYASYGITATRTALQGYQLGSQNDKPIASEAEAEALRTAVAGKQDALTAQQLANIAAVPDKLDKSGGTMTGPLSAPQVNVTRVGYSTWSIELDGDVGHFHFKAPRMGEGFGSVDLILPRRSDNLSGTIALAAPNPTTGNLAALDANGNPTDAGMTAGYLARYALTTKTISNGAVTLDDRAMNAVAVSSSLASLTINFPTATSGKVRDFGLRLSVASGITAAPELVLPQGVVCENADGEVPEIGADGAATILYFTETASGVFLVKGETLTAITQA